jgi:hypothetical protein
MEPILTSLVTGVGTAIAKGALKRRSNCQAEFSTTTRTVND